MDKQQQEQNQVLAFRLHCGDSHTQIIFTWSLHSATYIRHFVWYTIHIVEFRLIIIIDSVQLLYLVISSPLLYFQIGSKRKKKTARNF